MKLSCLVGLILFGIALHLSAAPAVVVSIADQKLAIVENGESVAQFPVSTSKFGVGDRPGSYATPLGLLEIASKIGANAPLGTVFKLRTPTGEILRPNARAFDRRIYIHGTPVERLIGRPASYGCIRMRSRDVANLFSLVNVGTRIAIVNCNLREAISRASSGTLATALSFAAN
jgi:L,D-transpeptidase catalytic domain